MMDETFWTICVEAGRGQTKQKQTNKLGKQNKT